MPVKLNIGLSKKIGQPNYSSLGASCHVECELEASLLEQDLDGFQERVRHVYTACRQAVQDELTRPQIPIAGDRQDRVGRNGFVSHSRSRQNSVPQARIQHANVRPATDQHEDVSVAEVDLATDSAGSLMEATAETLSDDPSATELQIIFLRHLATQIRGLAFRRLEALFADSLLTPSRQLTSKVASQLIERLKRVRAGEVRLNQFLEGDDA